MDTCIHMAESLHCSPETITTLLTDFNPIQNKKLNQKKKRLPCASTPNFRNEQAHTGPPLPFVEKESEAQREDGPAQHN